jgi:hypothetical protein
MHAIEYAEKLRDTNTERDLAKNLRAMPEDERLAFILEMLDVHHMVALDLSNSCLHNRQLLETLVEKCIAKWQDVSAPGVWLEKLLPRLGFKRTVAILQESIDACPTAVAGAIYFLLRFAANEDEVSQRSFDNLFEMAMNKSSAIPAMQSHYEQLRGMMKNRPRKGLIKGNDPQPGG